MENSPSAPVLNRAQRALFPDIAMIVALIVLFYCLFGKTGFQNLLADTDTGWHILTGEKIVATGDVPHAEPYSFSKPGGPWFAWEWLADIILGLVHTAGGLKAVVFFAALVIAFTSWFWARLSRSLGGDPVLTGLLMGLAVSCSAVHWLARPHILSWSFLLAWIWLMEKAPERFKPLHAVGAFVFMALWTNIHGSFFLAFLIAGGYVAGYWFQGERRRAIWITCAASAGFAATFVNPYGWHLHQHVVLYLLNSRMLSHINEFQSFNFNQEGGYYVMLLLMLAMTGVVLSLQQRKYGRALMLLLLLVIGFRSGRGIALIAFAAMPAVNGVLITALRPLSRLKPVFEETDNFARTEIQANGLVWGIGGIAAAWFMLSMPAVENNIGFPPDKLPVKAAACIEPLPQDARIFATDYFGGYLIYRFNTKRPVFVDGRSDYYGVNFITDYVKMIMGTPGWRPLFRQWNFTHALVPLSYPITDALEREGWRQVCKDNVAILFERGSVTGP